MMEHNSGPSAGVDAVDSAFHAGERAIQERVGVREKIEPYGRKGIRSFMPEQHRELFEKLPFLIVGTADPQDRVWAGMLAGEPGFMHSPDPVTLRIDAQPASGDPLQAGWHDGAPVGALGIELHTRRRNRLNGVLAFDRDRRAFSILVDQSFGNCPKYIQARKPQLVRTPSVPVQPDNVRQFTDFDEQARKVVARSDTFFVASRYGDRSQDKRHGIDVSHRGGRPGFVVMPDSKTLVWPDYRGNFFFNTLGNLAADPRCGLFLIDFGTGDTLQLTGHAQVIWEWDRQDSAVEGAQRLVQFELERGAYTRGGSPFEWVFQGAAPQFDSPTQSSAS
jgi:uncharacterized protein